MTQRVTAKAAVWFAAALALIALYAAARSCGRKNPPFQLSFWYWHSPFQIPQIEIDGLRKLGIKQLFVRAGTFTSDGTNVVLAIPQSYASKCPLDLQLVFNADSGVIRHFEDYDLPTITKQISKRILIQVNAARSKGERIAGVQLDFDCPTRLLPRYAELVHGVRQDLKAEKLQFSVTGLMSWLGTDGVRILSRELDFIVPQAYEGVTGRTADTMRPVSDEKDFRARIAKTGNLECPYYVGIPAYGHSFLFDETGKLSNVYRNLSPVEALRHPSFKLLDAYPADRLGKSANDAAASTGEEILKFKAIRPAPDGRGLGYTLAFTVPSPALLEKELKAAREVQTPDCLGAIVYRYPEPDSTLTLPFETALHTLEGKATKPYLSVKVDAATDNFDLIEGAAPAHEAPKDVFLVLENTGDAPTFIAPDAVVVDVGLNAVGVDEVRRRDMDSATPGRLDRDGKFETTFARQATAVRFTKGFLAPGEKAYVGPIRLLTSHVQKIDIRWIIRDSDGFVTYRGESVETLSVRPKK